MISFGRYVSLQAFLRDQNVRPKTCVATHLYESRQPKAHGREDVKVTKETWQLVPFQERPLGLVWFFLNRCHIKCSDVNSNVHMSV